MSDDSGIPEWGIDLAAEYQQDSRDKYIQELIEYLDDPDYEDVPVLIDGTRLHMPEGKEQSTIILLIRALKYLIQGEF
jgi:hypothetical protein